MTRPKTLTEMKGPGEMLPRDGDVLVSNPSATVEHVVSIVPAAPDMMCANHDSAVSKAHELAKNRHVDVWLTEDNRHFLKLASYRSEEP